MSLRLGWTVQISTPGFGLFRAARGLMSGRKQGFPLSLQEKRAHFDDTLECRKLSCFTAIETGSQGYSHLVSFRCNMPVELFPLRFQMLKSLYECEFRHSNLKSDQSLCQFIWFSMPCREPFKCLCVMKAQVLAVMHVLRGFVFGAFQPSHWSKGMLLCFS